jgi:transposase InsO family protein
LAIILDVFSKEVIAWNISVRHNKELITSTPNWMLKKRKTIEILYSDQDSEYRSTRTLLCKISGYLYAKQMKCARRAIKHLKNLVEWLVMWKG